MERSLALFPLTVLAALLFLLLPAAVALQLEEGVQVVVHGSAERAWRGVRLREREFSSALRFEGMLASVHSRFSSFSLKTRPSTKP